MTSAGNSARLRMPYIEIKRIDDRVDGRTMLQKVVATAAIIVAAAVVRLVVARLVQHPKWSNVNAGRRAIVVIRNLSLLLTALGITLVWSEQLRVVGLSMVAFVLALVIAGQDVIRSVLGSFVRATSSSFAVGDQIVVGDLRGYVIDSSLVSTTLLEIGSGHLRTGRTVMVPNSQFLTQPVINETAGHRFILHSFQVPVPQDQWQTAADVLQAAAELQTGVYVEPARREMGARAKRHSLSMPIVRPLVLGALAADNTVVLTVRVPTEAQDVWRVEHEIHKAWLEASSCIDPSVTRHPQNRRRDDAYGLPLPH